MKTRCLATGEELTWAACLDCARGGDQPCGWDYALLRAVKKHQERQRYGIHVSDVKSCLRKAWYERTSLPAIEAPSESMYVMLGTMTHNILEGSDHTVISEMPVSAKLNGYELLGTVDAYYPKLGRIVDYKTTRRISKDKLPYGDHEAQVVIYAIMLRQMGLRVESAAIQYIDLMGPAKCTYCKVGQLIPGQEIFTCKNCGTEVDAHHQSIHAGAVTYEVDLSNADLLAEEIELRLTELNNALESHEPPVGEPAWLCRYCKFNEECPDVAV